MQGIDARKLAGFLDDCSWSEGPMTPEMKLLLWMAAIWLDHEGKVMEMEASPGPSTLPIDDRFAASDFSRGCPVHDVAGPSISLGGSGPILAGETYALPISEIAD